MPVALVLRPDWPTTFRRTIRDDAGKPVRTLEFLKQTPVVVTDDEFIAMADDVGKAVVYAAVAADGLPLSKPAKDQGDVEELKPKRKKK